MISERLKKVILTELELDDVTLADETLAHEVPGWDSISHLKIVSAVEQEFGVRFGSLDIMRLKNVGELQTLVNRKTAGR